jgi:hypothetical protein
MVRRSFLRQLAALPFIAAASPSAPAADTAKLKILMKSAWGSDDPTKAAFPFLHADALSETGHNVQIFLLGEAVSLMRKSVAQCGSTGWLATSFGSSYQDRGQENSNLHMRRLFAGARNNGSRPGRIRRKIRQS